MVGRARQMHSSYFRSSIPPVGFFQFTAPSAPPLPTHTQSGMRTLLPPQESALLCIFNIPQNSIFSSAFVPQIHCKIPFLEHGNWTKIRPKEYHLDICPVPLLEDPPPTTPTHTVHPQSPVCSPGTCPAGWSGLDQSRYLTITGPIRLKSELRGRDTVLGAESH